MTTYDDFSSLLQLGVGIGIGLSIFRAPVDLRTARLLQVIRGEIATLRALDTPFAVRKRRNLLDLKLQLGLITAKLNAELVKFMVLAVLGAVLNLVGLILAALDPDGQPTPNEIKILLFVSVGWFLLLLVALEILARCRLSATQRDLVIIQKTTSTSVMYE